MASDEQVSRMKERFYEELRIKRESANTKNRVFIDDQRYEKLLEEINTAKTTKKKKSPRDYWLLQRYDFITVNQKHKLIFPVNMPNNNIIYYVADSELFHVLHDAHLSIGHGGRDRMLKELSTRYKNITRHDIELYLQLCEPCQQKHRGMKKRMKIVHGESRRSQSQGSLERANQDIENMLTTWMQDNDIERWSDGLRFVQLMNNRAFHSGIARALYEALFGTKIKVDTSLPLGDTRDLASAAVPVIATAEDRLATQNRPIEARYQLSRALESSEMENVQNRPTKRVRDEGLPLRPAEIFDEPSNVRETCTSGSPETQDQRLDGPDSSECNQSSNAPLLCCVCSEETTGAHSCKKCSRAIHSICATPKKSMTEGHGSKVVCPLCAKNALAVENCHSSEDNVQEQEQRILKTCEKKFPAAALSTILPTCAPEVDRACTDARHILATALQRPDDELYRLGTKQGVIETLYLRQQFTVCGQKLLSKDVVLNQDTTLRSIANLQSTGTGQGFVKCSCKQHCDTKRCLCLKHKMLCTSKCHNNSSCKNT